jgi:hypothetical protein
MKFPVFVKMRFSTGGSERRTVFAFKTEGEFE